MMNLDAVLVVAPDVPNDEPRCCIGSNFRDAI